jgi:hypothetical protein
MHLRRQRSSDPAQSLLLSVIVLLHCKAEFEKLLQQERQAGFSLLAFANKHVRRNHLPPPVARALMRGRICPARSKAMCGLRCTSTPYD